jgi:hypothetical protein
VLRWSVLLFALLVNAPELWRALVRQTIGVDAAVIHFLLAIPVGAVLLGLLRAATARGNVRSNAEP